MKLTEIERGRMEEERRTGYTAIITKLTAIATKVDGIDKRLDKINGSIEETNRTYPQYREKVDALEDDMDDVKPQVIGLRVKLYAGMGIISFCSAIIGAVIMKYLGA